MKIIQATEDDAKAIASLILQTAKAQLRGEFSDDGWDLFLKLLNEDTQKSLIKNKKFNYIVAVAERSNVAKNSDLKTQGLKPTNEIVGVLVIKDVNHIFHFFIKPSWQGKGLAKLLWDQAVIEIHDALNKQTIKAHNHKDSVSVNSSDFGLNFYQHIGFVMEAGRQKKNGICYTPMRFTFS
ncbi:MAG: GNAT superfamily N-acetyltransferase [Enterobacterales bacterium]|jgi:GNAT superfamily N-acetyltransferase